MKTPPGTKWYEVDELLIRPGESVNVHQEATARTIRCLKEGCDLFASGLDTWLGGRADRDTHLRVLQETLGRRCQQANIIAMSSKCPHPCGGLVSP